MSHAPSRLRGLFADDSFVRTRMQLEPTAGAREIAPLVTAAIEHLEAAPQPCQRFDPAKSECIFTAGMAWHRRNRSDPVQAWFRSQLVAAIGDSADNNLPQ